MKVHSSNILHTCTHNPLSTAFWHPTATTIADSLNPRTTYKKFCVSCNIRHVTDECTFPQKMLEMHFPAGKIITIFQGHSAGNRKGSMEIVRTCESGSMSGRQSPYTTLQNPPSFPRGCSQAHQHREETEGRLQMPLSPRKNDLTALFKEVGVFIRRTKSPKASFETIFLEMMSQG